MFSYNISTSKNKFQSLQEQTFQIMPARLGILNPFKFSKSTKTNTNILLHTGYDFHPFQSEMFDPLSKQSQLLNSYLETCKRIHVDQLLIHGPDQPNSLKYFECGLTILKLYLDDFNSNKIQFNENQNSIPSQNTFQNNTTQNKLQICIEMPAFTKSMYSILNNNIYDFILSYFKTIIDFGFDIVIDTAHLFSNGLNTQEIINVLELFKNNYKYIHLNGNCNPQFKKDKHTTLTDCQGYERNLIPNSELLLKKASELMNNDNKICISEQKCNNINYFKKLSKEYGFKLNECITEDIITN
jgi:hypothetical protein